LTRAVWEIKAIGFDFVIGTSGTVLNMVNAIAQAEAAYRTETRTDFGSFSETVTLAQLERMNKRLSKMKLADRKRVPGIEKGRADIIIAGGLLLETILSELGAREITSCDWSLREGVILNYLRSHSRQSLPQSRAHEIDALSKLDERFSDESVDDSKLDVRTRSVLSVGRRFCYDAGHSHHVAKLASRIFDDTRELHGLGENELKLLQHASLLHDIGYHIAHNNHHRHGLYLIKNSEMPGFTGNEIALMATLVRYHRGSMPSKGNDAGARREHEDFYSLERGQRSILLRLAAILQIADGLDRCHRQVVGGVRCELRGAIVLFNIECEGECDLEMWAAERKAAWFKEVFKVEVEFNRVCQAPAHQDVEPAKAVG
jgi:exopolyphosphatase/guanosine-5'-triphosphate,3'-diphosphate pyrophosphatase